MTRKQTIMSLLYKLTLIAAFAYGAIVTSGGR